MIEEKLWIILAEGLQYRSAMVIVEDEQYNVMGKGERCMKKRIALFVLTVMTVLAIPAATFAAGSITDITGTVKHNGSPVSGANVTVTCSGHNGSDTTNGSGDYVVQFDAADCPTGSSASASAVSGGLNGSNSGTVNGITTRLNVAIVDVSVVPEYGIIGLTGAAILGGGAFMVMRRRQIGDNQA